MHLCTITVQTYLFSETLRYHIGFNDNKQKLTLVRRRNFCSECLCLTKMPQNMCINVQLLYSTYLFSETLRYIGFNDSKKELTSWSEEETSAVNACAELLSREGVVDLIGWPHAIGHDSRGSLNIWNLSGNHTVFSWAKIRLNCVQETRKFWKGNIAGQIFKLNNIVGNSF